MAYVKTIWVDDETVVNATRMNHIEDGIKNLESISLLAVSDTAPSECVEGDLYYNTTTKKIYQAIDTNTWDSEGTDPIDKILYIVFSTKTTYSLDENGDLISVGGGGAEIAVSTTEPEEDEVLWIDPEEDSVEAEGTYISNTYGVSTEKGYSQEYLNGTILYENATGTNGNITLSDNVSNYRYIEIFGYDTLFYSNVYTKYDLSMEQNINLSHLSTNGTQNRLQTAIYEISGTSLTLKNAYMNVIFGTSVNSQTTNNEFNITKIIGYK